MKDTVWTVWNQVTCTFIHDFNPEWKHRRWTVWAFVLISLPYGMFPPWNDCSWLDTGQMSCDLIMKVTNKMQLFRLIYFSLSALHVWGDVFAHHQEHLTVLTVSGSIHPGCCRLVSWMSWKLIQDTRTIRYCKYSQVLLMMGENIARNM
jgi:hypothetical protein